MEFSKGYRGWLLFVLLLANAMNLADRQTMAVLGQAIKSELQFSDTQLGIRERSARATGKSPGKSGDRRGVQGFAA